MRILAFVTESATVRCILEHVGESAVPSPLSPSGAPPGKSSHGRGAARTASTRARSALPGAVRCLGN